MTDFIPHPDHRLFDAERQVALDPEASVTFAEVLRDSGYRTGLLGGSVPDGWDQDVFAEYHMIHYAEAEMWCYRKPRFKLVRDRTTRGRDEFFDLAGDPGESTNLIDSPDPEVQAAIGQLDRKLRERMRSVGALLAPCGGAGSMVSRWSRSSHVNSPSAPG